MAHVLVIGGTLFIGRALVERLLDRGDEVVVMHRGRGTPFGERVGEIKCDRNDVAAVREALKSERFDAVYDNVYDWERGTTGEQVRAAAEAAAHDGLRRYVFMSSVAAYGKAGDGEFDERDELTPPSDPNMYNRQKAESERALFALHRARGVPVTTIRPAFVYGPFNQYPRESFFWDRILDDRPIIIPGDGTRTMQWAWSEDVARTCIVAAEQDVAIGGSYNVGNYPPITQLDFVRTLARVAGREPKLVHVDRDRIEAAGGQLTVPPLYFGAYLDLPAIPIKVERVRSELGVELAPLEVGLRETFRWYQQQPRTPWDYTWEDRLIARAG